MSPFVPEQEQQQEQPEKVPDGHGRFYESVPWQKEHQSVYDQGKKAKRQMNNFTGFNSNYYKGKMYVFSLF